MDTERCAETLERDHDLIASDRVEGTTVYDRAGEKLGTVRKFMVGKRSGRVDFAILGFGGLFGVAERHYPLPWDMLTYNPDKGGYVVDLDKDQIDNAPYFEGENAPEFDARYGQQVYGYYGVLY